MTKDELDVLCQRLNRWWPRWDAAAEMDLLWGVFGDYALEGVEMAVWNWRLANPDAFRPKFAAVRDALRHNYREADPSRCHWGPSEETQLHLGHLHRRRYRLAGATDEEIILREMDCVRLPKPEERVKAQRQLIALLRRETQQDVGEYMRRIEAQWQR